jgi:hypothetical protein
MMPLRQQKGHSGVPLGERMVRLTGWLAAVRLPPDSRNRQVSALYKVAQNHREE